MRRVWTSGITLILTCGILPVPTLAQAAGYPEGRRTEGAAPPLAQLRFVRGG